jgi:hypothetical protein
MYIKKTKKKLSGGGSKRRQTRGQFGRHEIEAAKIGLLINLGFKGLELGIKGFGFIGSMFSSASELLFGPSKPNIDDLRESIDKVVTNALINKNQDQLGILMKTKIIKKNKGRWDLINSSKEIWMKEILNIKYINIRNIKSKELNTEGKLDNDKVNKKIITVLQNILGELSNPKYKKYGINKKTQDNFKDFSKLDVNELIYRIPQL